MIITHNMVAMNAQRQLSIVTNNKAKSSEKLNSGYRINRASDDAAGLSISEKMRSQIRGLERGINNALEGISLCQVMDGALSEVNEMLHRITELSIQAANDTNTDEDRQAIQAEINQIIQEINRVGDNTQFNGIYPFRSGKGSIDHLQNDTGNSTTVNDIPFSDYKLTDINLGMHPFTDSSDPNHLALQAIVDNADSPFNGETFNLIFGNGSTSNSSFKLDYLAGGTTYKEIEVKMSELSTPICAYDAATYTWTRTYHYTNTDGIDLNITQSVKPVENTDTEKNYEISYTFENNKPDLPTSLAFMFHADTAYNNNDACEGYYMNGAKIENNCVYTNNISLLTNGQSSPYIYVADKVPDSFSIVDIDDALAFSEKISFPGTDNNRPYSVSIGLYSQIDDWSYYENLSSNLGGDTNREDLGFSLYFSGAIGNADNSRDGESVTFSFNYGIIATQSDQNLTGITSSKDTTPTSTYNNTGKLWIQSGAIVHDGMFLTLTEMNAGILGINDANVSTREGALQAIEATDLALQKILDQRSVIGAEQNRLEHTIANERNIVENTTAAESRIRDTDMASEMVNYSKDNILENFGQAMLAQANQISQNVLSLLE